MRSSLQKLLIGSQRGTLGNLVLTTYYLGGGFLGWTIGRALGRALSDNREIYLPEVNNEDEIRSLADKTGKPVFVQFLVPGVVQAYVAREGLARARDSPFSELASFAAINCAKQLSLCQAVGMRPGGIHVDVYFPKVVDPKRPSREFHPVVPYLNNFNQEGMDAFLRNHNVLPPKEHITRVTNTLTSI
jgi:hypothetical protein